MTAPFKYTTIKIPYFLFFFNCESISLEENGNNEIEVIFR